MDKLDRAGGSALPSMQVVLVCSDEDSLSAEMEMLHAVHAAVVEDGRAHVMVYAADQACKMEVWHLSLCADFLMLCPNAGFAQVSLGQCCGIMDAVSSPSA